MLPRLEWKNCRRGLTVPDGKALNPLKVGDGFQWAQAYDPSFKT